MARSGAERLNYSVTETLDHEDEKLEPDLKRAEKLVNDFKQEVYESPELRDEVNKLNTSREEWNNKAAVDFNNGDSSQYTRTHEDIGVDFTRDIAYYVGHETEATAQYAAQAMYECVTEPIFHELRSLHEFDERKTAGIDMIPKDVSYQALKNLCEDTAAELVQDIAENGPDKFEYASRERREASDSDGSYGEHFGRATSDLTYEVERIKKDPGMSFQEHFDQEMEILRGDDTEYEPKTSEILETVGNVYERFIKDHSLTFNVQAAESITDSLIAEGYAKKENAGSIVEALVNKGADSHGQLRWDEHDGIYGGNTE